MELYNSENPQITHAELVDIVYEHVSETGIMQTSTKALTSQETGKMLNEISPGLSVEVKRAQHGRFDSDFAKAKEKDVISLQKIHRRLSTVRKPASVSPENDITITELH